MQISLTHPSDTQVKLAIIPQQSELEAVKKSVLQRLSGRVKIAGFREGKAPLELIEKQLDQALLQNEFIEEAVNQMFLQAIEQHALRPITNPQVNLKKFVPFTALEFEAEIEVIGKVELPDYKAIKKTLPDVKVTAKDVDEVISQLKVRSAEKKDVDRAAQAGDQVWIDFKGEDAKGLPVNGAEGKDYPLILGSNTFIPGFEDNVLGMQPGEVKTFTLTFPKDYGVKALANKKVTFTVTATKVQEVIEPAVDDAFAAKVGPFKSVQALRDDIQQQLETEQKGQAQRTYENELILEIASKAKVAIPSSLVDAEVERIEQEEKQNLMYRGQTWEEHLKEEGVTPEEHKQQKRPAAEERVKAGIVLSEISQREGLEVTPEELEIRIQVLKGQYNDAAMRAELDKPEARREIASRILTEKTVNTLVAHASQASTKKK